MTNPRDHSTSRVTTPVRDLVGAQVLVVDQDPRIHSGMNELLTAANLHPTCVKDPEAAITALHRQFYSVVLVDLDTPTPGAGIDTVRAIRGASPTSMIIAMTPRRSFDDAVNAVRAGAVDLILKSPESVLYLKDRVMEAAGKSVGRREVDSVLVDVRTAHEEFLQRFMDSERRALDAADRLAGKDPSRSIEMDAFAVLVVDEVDSLVDDLKNAAPVGFRFVHALGGGEALDRISSDSFQYALVSDEVHDLPASMVIQAIRTQSPDTVVMAFRGPGPGGYVNLVEIAGQRPIVTPFTDGAQLVARMDEFADAFRARARERRYTQNFRERHYDFLRRYVELKTKIERALNEGPG